jgi:hypothetical protein
MLLLFFKTISARTIRCRLPFYELLPGPSIMLIGYDLQQKSDCDWPHTTWKMWNADFTEPEMANIGLFLLHTPRQLYAGLSAATSWWWLESIYPTENLYRTPPCWKVSADTVGIYAIHPSQLCAGLPCVTSQWRLVSTHCRYLIIFSGSYWLCQWYLHGKPMPWWIPT